MIQRKQTIWLLLATLSILLTFLLPYGIHTESALETTAILQTDLNSKSNTMLMSLTILSATVSFFTIFLYSNRKLQMRLSILSIFLSMGVLACQIYISRSVDGNKLAIGVLGANIYLGLAAPVIAIAFLMLAYNGIKKDEKLVRDSDRLR